MSCKWVLLNLPTVRAKRKLEEAKNNNNNKDVCSHLLLANVLQNASPFYQSLKKA